MICYKQTSNIYILITAIRSISPAKQTEFFIDFPSRFLKERTYITTDRFSGSLKNYLFPPQNNCKKISHLASQNQREIAKKDFKRNTEVILTCLLKSPCFTTRFKFNTITPMSSSKLFGSSSFKICSVVLQARKQNKKQIKLALIGNTV